MDKQTEGIVQGIITFLKKYDLMGKLPEVATALQKEARNFKDRVVVESAVELDKNDKEEIEETLKQKWQIQSEPEFVVVPDLIGGIKVSIGDRVLDLSVKSKLGKIYEQV